MAGTDSRTGAIRCKGPLEGEGVTNVDVGGGAAVKADGRAFEAGIRISGVGHRRVVHRDDRDGRRGSVGIDLTIVGSVGVRGAAPVEVEGQGYLPLLQATG